VAAARVAAEAGASVLFLGPISGRHDEGHEEILQHKASALSVNTLLSRHQLIFDIPYGDNKS